MKKTMSMWIAVVFLTQAILASSQTAEKPAPPFTLTIVQVGYGGTTPGNYAVKVTLKNISDREIGDQGCLALRDWFNVSVVYNGTPMEETDAVRRLKRWRRPNVACEGSHTGWKIGPGQEYFYQLNVNEFYGMSEPGIYHVTVTRETDPRHPESSVTVTSNTVTIVVPKSDANKDK